MVNGQTGLDMKRYFKFSTDKDIEVILLCDWVKDGLKCAIRFREDVIMEICDMDPDCYKLLFWSEDGSFECFDIPRPYFDLEGYLKQKGLEFEVSDDREDFLEYYRRSLRHRHMEYWINDKWFASTLYCARAVGESLNVYFKLDKDCESVQLHSLWISGNYMPHIDFRIAVGEVLQTLKEMKNDGTAPEMAEVLLTVCLKYNWLVCLEIHKDKDYRFIGKDHDRDCGRVYFVYDLKKYYFNNPNIEENLKYWKQLMESDDVKLQNFLNKALLLGVMET